MLKIASEQKIKFHVFSEDNKKVFTWEAPLTSTLEESYKMMDYLKNQIWIKIEEDKRKAKEQSKQDNKTKNEKIAEETKKDFIKEK